MDANGLAGADRGRFLFRLLCFQSTDNIHD